MADLETTTSTGNVNSRNSQQAASWYSDASSSGMITPQRSPKRPKEPTFVDCLPSQIESPDQTLSQLQSRIDQLERELSQYRAQPSYCIDSVEVKTAHGSADYNLSHALHWDDWIWYCIIAGSVLATVLIMFVCLGFIIGIRNTQRLENDYLIGVKQESNECSGANAGALRTTRC